MKTDQPGHAGGHSNVTLLKENVTMFDLTPLYRSTVGFDRLARMLDEASSFEAPTYPPYNIERLAEDEYRITMAVAGFAPEDITIEVKGNGLTVSGKKAEKAERDRDRPSSCTRASRRAPSSAASSLPITCRSTAPAWRTACFTSR